MDRLAWISDPHLNFVERGSKAWRELVRAARAAGAVLLGGDISEAHTLERDLRALQQDLHLPVYFVLGNHDFYGGGVDQVRQRARALSQEQPQLCWLPAVPGGHVPLGADVALLGVDGWGDARLGNAESSPVALNDFLLIEDHRNALVRERLVAHLRELGDRDAEELRENLQRAATHHRLVVLTHVPPFREACWHAGSLSSDDWLPYFACDAVGRVLAEFAGQHPGHELLVLCGHTHGGGRAQIQDNLLVVTGPADYGSPTVQGIVDPGAPTLREAIAAAF
jgi:3',5'-cyclic AMP phosphodiesterase CpdA